MLEYLIVLVIKYISLILFSKLYQNDLNIFDSIRSVRERKLNTKEKMCSLFGSMDFYICDYHEYLIL